MRRETRVMTKTSSTRSSLTASLDLVEIKPGVKFSKAALKDLLPDVETTLFFGKVYELNHVQLSHLLQVVCKTPLVDALLGEGGMHSNELQDYLIDISYHVPEVTLGDLCFNPTVPHGEILPQVWESMQVEVATSIKAVAAKLEHVVSHMPGKQGHMLFNSLMVMNRKRPTIGDFRAQVKHHRQTPNLVILDVSGSMTSSTVSAIIEDVVALSYSANASLAIVSNTCTVWEPGTYDVDTVLSAAEFGGTQYETLAPLLNQDWGVVVTIADYDSSPSAKSAIAQQSTGHIDLVLDVSLVNQTTYLAKCVGQLADEVKPLLVGNSDYVLS